MLIPFQEPTSSSQIIPTTIAIKKFIKKLVSKG